MADARPHYMTDDRHSAGHRIDARPVGAVSGVRRSDLAYDHIKRQLIDGGYRQGDGLPVERIAHNLGMSRQPVMEAMKRLREHGFVEIIPQVGCRVAIIDRREAADLFRYLAVTEGLLAELAAMRWTAAQLARLRQSCDAISELVSADKEDNDMFLRYRDLNNTLHGTIWEMAAAPLVARAAQRMTERCDFHIATTPIESVAAKPLAACQREHEEILHCIEHRDATRASQVLAKHVLGFYEQNYESAKI